MKVDHKLCIQWDEDDANPTFELVCEKVSDSHGDSINNSDFVRYFDLGAPVVTTRQGVIMGSIIVLCKD